MSARWTPGPWGLKSFDLSNVQSFKRNDLVHDEFGRLIAYVRRDAEFSAGEGEANANLIAAAPALVSEIQYVLDFVGDESLVRSDGEVLDVTGLRKSVELALRGALMAPYWLEEFNGRGSGSSGSSEGPESGE